MTALLALGLPDDAGFGESLQFQLVGFTIVLLVLATLWFLIRVVGACFQHFDRPAPVSPAAPPAVAAQAPPPEVVAAITAAVHIVMGEPHRIVSIRSARPTLAQVNVQAWSVEGRRQIFSSHAVR